VFLVLIPVMLCTYVTQQGAHLNPKLLTSQKIGSVLVVGGGIAGIQASLDLAESGYKVYLIEKSPAIGGRMPQLDKTFPTNDCAMCILSPKLVECGRHLNIEIITYADLLDVRGKPGKFKVRVKKRARYIDSEKCTGCGSCYSNWPVKYKAYVQGKERGTKGG